MKTRCTMGVLMLLALISCGAPTVVIDRPPDRQPFASSISSISSVSSESSVPSTHSSIPPSLRITVPFTPQAPFADWGYPYQEACEEASLIMVHHFLEETPLSLERADAEILALVEWQTRNGYPQDVAVAQLAEIARAYYGYEAEIIENPDAEVLKQLVAQGYPVIAPAAGRMLGNPYFSGEGPFYHMLVITGYDGDAFITHDPGTRRGEHYRYRSDVLLNAIHDWTGVKEETAQGARRVLVLRPS